ncbi:MAG: VWA domain-containing protein, partial [Candidatus Thorarchaeota archaeon]|nr:VWA domain-containing protein [Candidatus Thorarchaeota archaeon]
MALETRTGHWSAGQVKENSKCSEKTIVISEIDSSIAGFRNSSVVNIVKIEGEIPDINKLVLSYKSEKPLSNTELLSSMHLHEIEVLDSIDGRYVGLGSKLQVGSHNQPLTLSIGYSEPNLKSGQIGRISRDGLILRPHQSFRELNVVICLSKGKNMSKKDIPFKSLHSARRELEELSNLVPEVGTFLSSLNNTLSPSEISALSALLVVNTLVHNRTEGRLGLVTFADSPEKFSVQYGSEIRSSVEFLGDLQSEEVLISLIFSILDNVKETGGYEKMDGAYRSIAEYLEDFGPSRPTLLLVFSGSVGKYDEENLPFIQAINENERYQIEFFTFDKKT